MIKLRADELSPTILSHVAEPIQIVDATGQVIGQFIPDPERIKRLYAATDHLPDPAELERRLAAEGPGCTTRELFQHLLSLTADPQMQAYLREKITKLAARDGCSTP
jgi:hypothetical protein